jgi:hypothetical protein
MSTLTSSPSPAASPHDTFRLHRASYPSLQFPSPSYKPRAFNAPSALQVGGSGIRHPQEHNTQRTHKYVDAGTQYSPDAYPPTADRAFLEQQQNQRALSSPPPSVRKRKQAQSPSPEPMSTSSSSNSSSRALQPPPEPEARRDPTPAREATTPTVAGPSTRPNDEPQEARSTQGLSKRAKPEPGSNKVMPSLYQNCNPRELGVLISGMLMELIRLNDQIPLRDGRLTRFHSRAPPGISVSDYLARLIHHATLSPPILLSMVWYIDLLCQLYPAFTINSLTVHRFLITAATVAAKGLSDSFWTNPTYAKIGGIPVSELATLELDFLDRVNWKIVPKPEMLEDYYRSLVDRTDGYELETEESNDSTSIGESEDEDDPTVDQSAP